MKILLTPGVYLPHQRAGSEIYLHKIAKYLQSVGHDVLCIARAINGVYEYEGITVFPCDTENWKHDNNDVWEWADLVITQLSGTYYAMNKMRIHHKKIINVAHNNGAYAQIPIRKNVYTIYNCENTKRELNYFHDSVVCPPPIFREHYKDVDRTGAKYITLINHNENKGGKILIEIAKRMPEYEFMAVQGGYYEQIYSKEPNIKYVPMVEDIRPYLAQTRILIAPSEYESYGQAQVEAMCCGIPVLTCNDNIFKEAMNGHGSHVWPRENIDGWLKAIVNLNNPILYPVWSMDAFDRASELTPEKDLENLNIWLEKINNLALK